MKMDVLDPAIRVRVVRVAGKVTGSAMTTIPPGRGLVADPTHAREESNDFTELSQLITESGLMRRRYVYYWTKLLAVPLVLAAFVLVFIWIGESWWQLVTAAVLAVVLTQVAMLGHDAAHGRSSAPAGGTTGRR